MTFLACVTLAACDYAEQTEVWRDETQLLGAEMDSVQQRMRSWGGAEWSARRYGGRRVSQAWFIKVASLTDRELANEIYTGSGYDSLTQQKGYLHMDVVISSAPSSEWRVAQVKIELKR